MLPAPYLSRNSINDRMTEPAIRRRDIMGNAISRLLFEKLQQRYELTERRHRCDTRTHRAIKSKVSEILLNVNSFSYFMPNSMPWSATKRSWESTVIFALMTKQSF